MLVLSRHKDQAIIIGDDIKITIVDVRGDKVRLGIDAPRSIPVHREEIYDIIQKEKSQSPNCGTCKFKETSIYSEPCKECYTKGDNHVLYQAMVVSEENTG